MALIPCRECGANVSIEAQTCPHCGAPDPTKVKNAAPDPTKVKNAAPDPTKDKSGAPDPTKDESAAPNPTKDKSAGPDPTKSKVSRWMIAGVIFILVVLTIIVGRSLPSAPPVPPPVPPVPQKEEDLTNMTEQQLINSLPANYKTALISLEQGNRRSAAISIKTQAEAVAPQPNPKILATIDAIIKKEEHTVPYLYSQGNGYLANKQYDLAIQKFDEAISLGDTKSYDSRGTAWLAKHEYERAIADFTQAAKIEHDNYLVYLHRAEANEQKGDRDSAIDDYHRALALAPDKPISNRINAALNRLTPPLQPELATPPPGRRR
jgi:hypothetical protein